MVQVSPVAARQGHCQQNEKKKLLCVSSFQLENFLRVPSTVATSIGLSPLSSVKVRVSDPQAVVKLASIFSTDTVAAKIFRWIPDGSPMDPGLFML